MTEPTTHRPRRIPRPALQLALLAVVLIGATTAAAQETEPSPITQARQATVYLMQTYDLAGTQAISCVGSGTLLSSTGLILTNAHLAEPLGPCRGERIIVALPVRLDEPPVPTYLAEVVVTDTRFDLAVLQIAGSLDGSQIDPEMLNLPFVSTGDPSGLLPGNTLTYVGYPDTGASNVTAIEGQITGITTEKSGSRFAWFRTEVELGGTMSGGGAYDANGRLVGIPTSAPATTGDEPGSMCLGIQDNNNDGLITERDACVPIGGAVTAIRPVSFAIPLIESARNGFELRHTSGLSTTSPTGEPTLERLFFSEQVSDLGVPTRIVSTLPGEPTSLFLFFDYDNMQSGTPYEIRVTRDGAAMPGFSLGPLAWGGGQKGTWYFGTENITWPNGNYEFTLLLNGEIVTSAGITIGGAPGEPIFGDLVFGTPDGEGGFKAIGTPLPAGISQINAVFSFENLAEGQDWAEAWYLDGVEISRVTRLWDREPNGQAVASAINYEGLPLGTYRLELFIGERLAATGEVTLAGNPDAQGNSAVFSNARLASDITRDGQPGGQIVTSGAVLPLGITDLYTFVNWDFMPNGLTWTYRWFLDGRLVASNSQPWNAGGVGQDFWVNLHADRPLPEGVYAVEVLVENRPMFSANVSIGSGTQPVAGEEGAGTEVEISGTVVDALTGEGIPNALVAVLDVQLESPQFTWDESEIYTQATTDRQGRFELPQGLTRSNYFTFFVFAEGYITVVEDNFWILKAHPAEVDITVEMSRP